MALDEAEIVVTPHALAPAMDGLRPSDIDFLRNGSFNLGFIALRRGAESLSLLDWWERRCLSHGFNDLGFGTFVDQKWIDLVPSYFESVHVLRHRGCNVAYWNLHERQLFEVNGSYRVNDVPLVFFHFSGVRADAPEVLSKHQTRHAIAPGSLLARLVSEYSASLLQMGHSSYSKLAYGFGRLDDGTRITSLMRRAACCVGASELHPFAAGSNLQRRLRASGITPPPSAQAEKGTSTLNFDQTSRKVVMANRLVRTLARLVGRERLLQILRYAAFLTRGSNYASVLLGYPFDLQHEDRR